MNFCLISSKLYLWPYTNAIICLFLRKMYLIQTNIYLAQRYFAWIIKFYFIWINLLSESNTFFSKTNCFVLFNLNFFQSRHSELIKEKNVNIIIITYWFSLFSVVISSIAATYNVAISLCLSRFTESAMQRCHKLNSFSKFPDSFSILCTTMSPERVSWRIPPQLPRTHCVLLIQSICWRKGCMRMFFLGLGYPYSPRASHIEISAVLLK